MGRSLKVQRVYKLKQYYRRNRYNIKDSKYLTYTKFTIRILKIVLRYYLLYFCTNLYSYSCIQYYII